jgi:arylsulfatase A-like enzyme
MCCAYFRSLLILCICQCQASQLRLEFNEDDCWSRYLISDDLRPEFGAYGQSVMVTPNVDRLAAEGTVFLRAYCQQAVCGPSRASFMTGRRPHHTQVFGNGADFREHGLDARGTPGAEWITMPEHFKRANWTTLGGGKTFHVSPRHECTTTVVQEACWF